MFGNIFIAAALSFAVGIGAVNTPEQNYNNDNINNVVYDDENYSITLSAEELINYTWQNLYNNEDISSLFISYGINQFLYNSTNSINGYIIFTDTNVNEYNITLYNQSLTIYIDEEEFNKLPYSFVYDEGGSYLNFQDDLVLTTSEYDTIKSSIELDIQANTTQASMGSNIIDAIKSGLGLIGDLASQFLLGFSTLFWANNALTPFGTFALVMLGVAITMAVVSLVLRIIRGNTGA